MHPAILYTFTVLIWGTTWYAITFQLGAVDPLVSVAYRFAIASLMLFGYCLIKKSGRSLKFTPMQHGFLMLQGLFLFFLVYWVLYIGTAFITSGLVAVCFALITMMNIFNQMIFMRITVKPRILLGGLLGLIGIALVFWPEVIGAATTNGTLYGIGLCILSAYLASIGNIISLRNSRDGMPIIQTNAYAMGYGALCSMALAMIMGKDISFDPSWPYILSLIYLAFFGSVIGFGMYLTLIAKTGADKAAYVAVLFPIVALGISTLYEDYQWTWLAALGIILVGAGNILAQTKSGHIKLSAFRRAREFRD